MSDTHAHRRDGIATASRQRRDDVATVEDAVATMTRPVATMTRPVATGNATKHDLFDP